MLNKATIIGRLGKDPETRYTGSGKAVASFSVATDETWKNNAGEKQKKTSWHNITVWGKLAEICQQYLKKGAQVYIEGRLDYQTWEKDGVKHYKTVIVADQMKMLGSKGDSSSRQHEQADAPAEEFGDGSSPEESTGSDF